MANSLNEVMPKLLAQGLLTLRQNAIAARLVNRQYETTAGERGSIVEVPIPSAIAARDVTPGVTWPQAADLAPKKAYIPLDQWKEAPFQLSDKDQLEVMAGVIPMQAREAIKTLANAVDSYILGLYKNVYSYAGTAGTTPFSTDVTAFTDGRVQLNKELCPVDDRFVLLGPDAEGNAVKLADFMRHDGSGDSKTIISGRIGTRFGAQWYMDQNVLTHTKGTNIAAATVNGAHAAGVAGVATSAATPNIPASTSSIVLAGATASQAVAWARGDIVSFAGHSQTYAVVADAASTAGGAATITITPALRVAVANGAAVTTRASHVVNLQMHRDAFAFASRPLVGSADELGSKIMSAVDPVSGLSLRLEVARQYKQTIWSFDILYGGQCIRQEFAARIAG